MPILQGRDSWMYVNFLWPHSILLYCQYLNLQRNLGIVSGAQKRKLIHSFSEHFLRCCIQLLYYTGYNQSGFRHGIRQPL